MDQHAVALVPVEDYDLPRVTEAVRTGLRLLGGVSAFISPQ